MKYGITKAVLGSPGFIEIDEAEYCLIRRARENLFEALFLEEKLDLVIEDFYEYETELLAMASRMMIFHKLDYFSMSNERNLIGRRIVNLLSASETYLDQNVHHVENIYGKNSENFNLIKAETSSQYDKRLGYRTMEAMRNYVKHRGLPIHSISFPHQKVNSDDDFRLSFRVIPQISILALEEDGNFKKNVLNELKETHKKDLVDTRPLIREYVEGIGTIHEKTREIIRGDLTNWEIILNNAITKFQDVIGKEVPLAGLSIVKENDDGHWEEYKSIFKEFLEKRQILEKKNRLFVNLSKCYASNEIRAKDA